MTIYTVVQVGIFVTLKFTQ